MLIKRVIEEGTSSVRDLADAAGLSYDALRSWSVGRREPQSESLRQLASGLRKRRDELDKLAEELEKAAEGGEHGDG